MSGEASILKESLPIASKFIHDVGDRSMKASTDVGIVGKSAGATRDIIRDTLGPMQDLINAISEIEGFIRTIGQFFGKIQIPIFNKINTTHARIDIPTVTVETNHFDKTVVGVGIKFDYISGVKVGQTSLGFDYASGIDFSQQSIFGEVRDKFIATAENIGKTKGHLTNLKNSLNDMSKDGGPLDDASKTLADASKDLKEIGDELKKINISDQVQ